MPVARTHAQLRRDCLTMMKNQRLRVKVRLTRQAQQRQVRACDDMNRFMVLHETDVVTKR